MPSEKTFYHPELDVLRFVAFLMVFTAHSNYYVNYGWDTLTRLVYVPAWALYEAGYYGVDLFFVLSAYLITELLLRERDRSGSVDLRKFYIRRMLRIWPLYFFFLLAVRPLAALYLTGDVFSGSTLAWFLLLAGNWHCVLFGLPKSVAAPLWSISLEEQFYLAWPVAVRCARKWLVAAAVGMLAAANLARLYLVHLPQNGATIWCNTLARLDPLAGGILLAILLHRKQNTLPHWQRWGLGTLACTLLLLVGFFGDHSSRRALFSYPVADLACTLLLFAVLRPMGSWTPGPLGRRLASLGRISYGLYVYHLLLFELIAHHLGLQQPILILLLVLSAAILVASLSYRLLELPFLRLKERFEVVRSRDALVVERQTIA